RSGLPTRGVVVRAAVEAEKSVALRHFPQRPAVLVDAAAKVLVVLVAAAKMLGIGLKPGIKVDQRGTVGIGIDRLGGARGGGGGRRLRIGGRGRCCHASILGMGCEGSSG